MKERQTQRGMGMKSTGGEIVQVEGGHIVRSTGRKDRHSKVCTAKGPRDRRVRLSAHTAIQFYDVQDRLGYDRPSKAVDWLMKKAKNAIDKLAELPPWNPIPNNATTEDGQETTEQNGGGGSNEMAIVPAEQSESSGGYNFQLQENNSAFMPSNIDTDAIAFFPTTYAASSINFQTYHPSNNYAAHDLGLSLHSFQNSTPSSDQTLFSGTNPVGFEANYQRIVNWNNDTAAVTTASDTNRTGFMVNSAATGFLGQGSAFSQRGSLQSNFSPSLRPWNDISTASNEYHHHGHKAQPIHQASIFGSSFLSDALPGFYIPARIQGEDESHGVASDRPSSSSNSHH